MTPNGEFGGVLVRSLTTAGGTLPPGTEIDAETALSWPVSNRTALSEGGIVRWHSVAASPERRGPGRPRKE